MRVRLLRLSLLLAMSALSRPAFLLHNVARRHGRTAVALAQERRGCARVALAEGRHLSTKGSARAKDARLDDIELTFLGTASALPSLTRNQQGLAVRLGGETWLFDCGEATQHQMMRTPISPADVRRIFISHLHGDHVYGLPGMLCGIAVGNTEYDEAVFGGRESAERTPGEKYLSEVPPLQLIGPEGLRAFVRTALLNSYASLGSLKIQIHELVGLRAGTKHERRPPVRFDVMHPNEVAGQTIERSADGSWEVPAVPGDPPCRVRAVEMNHTVPTVGWVLHEEPRPGKLDAERIHPLLKEHNVPMHVLRGFKMGTPIELPDGTTLRPEDFMEPPTRRKVAILSDSRDSSAAAAHVRGADLLVHEATNAYTAADRMAGRTPGEVRRSTLNHGHSTPEMAGDFASSVDAQRLVLTHFSPRYAGDDSKHSRAVMADIRALAGKKFDGDIISARDHMALTLTASGELSVSSALRTDLAASGPRVALGAPQETRQPERQPSPLNHTRSLRGRHVERPGAPAGQRLVAEQAPQRQQRRKDLDDEDEFRV